MSSTRQQPELNLLSIETVSANPHLNPTDGIRHGTETCSITIHSNYSSRSNLQTFSHSFTSLNIPFTNGDCNNTTQLRDPLEVLNIITDICLIISAVIVVVSIGIVFSIVGLAIMRMYFIIGFNEANVTRRFMLNVNELH